MKVQLKIISMLLIYLLFLSGCGSQSNDINQLIKANQNTQNALKTQLRNQVKCDISQDQTGNFIGYVYNNSIKDIEDMTIHISFYDKDNAKMGEQLIIINELKHDEKYKINELRWSKFDSAKTWQVTNKDITFTDSDYN